MHLRVLADALAGLHHAHELKDYDGTPLSVVHRDASPQNIFVRLRHRSILTAVLGCALLLGVTDVMAQQPSGTSNAADARAHYTTTRTPCARSSSIDPGSNAIPKKRREEVETLLRLPRPLHAAGLGPFGPFFGREEDVCAHHQAIEGVVQHAVTVEVNLLPVARLEKPVSFLWEERHDSSHPAVAAARSRGGASGRRRRRRRCTHGRLRARGCRDC
jgi:hypothetical protein